MKKHIEINWYQNFCSNKQIETTSKTEFITLLETFTLKSNYAK